MIIFTFSPIHRTILLLRSAYYANMFNSNMVESLNNEVEVPDADPKAFCGLLQFLYSGLPLQNLADIATGLYIISDKHGQMT